MILPLKPQLITTNLATEHSCSTVSNGLATRLLSDISRDDVHSLGAKGKTFLRDRLELWQSARGDEDCGVLLGVSARDGDPEAAGSARHHHVQALRLG